MGEYREFVHAPGHLFIPRASYMVTASTYRKAHFYDSKEKLRNLTDTLLNTVAHWGWMLEAWSVFSNHYHLVATAPEDPLTLTRFIRAAHSITAKYVNAVDGTKGRRVWHNYWDTCITGEQAYLARLKYAHLNAVKHGLVEKPEDYPYSSYSWFVNSNPSDLCERVFNQTIDLLELEDVP